MQNRYVGDVGDFGKYGLLRALVVGNDGGPSLPLGVIWYLTPDDPGGGAGRHISYLDTGRERAYRRCDAHVYDRLRTIVLGARRSVLSIEQAAVLPPKTLFYRKPVPKRREHRERWAVGAREAMAAAHVVFVDPDNGLEGKNPTDKHVLFDELVPLCDGKRTIVIYQQQGRMRRGRTVEIPWRLRQIRERLPEASGAFGLRFARGTSRVFIVVPSADHADVLRQRARTLIAGPWGQQGHFDPLLHTL